MLEKTKLIGILRGVLVSWIGLDLFSPRYVYLYLLLIAAIVLPLARWMRWSVRSLALLLSGVALAFALSPIDIIVQSTGRREVALMQVIFGLGCDPGTAACYGCIGWHNAPRYAVVLSP